MTKQNKTNTVMNKLARVFKNDTFYIFDKNIYADIPISINKYRIHINLIISELEQKNKSSPFNIVDLTETIYNLFIKNLFNSGDKKGNIPPS